MSNFMNEFIDKGVKNVKTDVVKAKREKKKRKALLKKASNAAAKFRKEEEEAIKSGKKFNRIEEMRKRRKALLKD